MPSVQDMQAERDGLVARVQRLDGLIERQRALDAEYQADYLNLTAPVASVDPAEPPAPSASNGGRKRGPNGSPADEIVAAAIIAVNKANKPLTRYELVDAVEARNLTVGGADKARNMGTILWRSKAFDNEGEGYRPKDWKPAKDHDL